MLPFFAKYKLNSSILSIGTSGKSVIILDSNYHLYELRDGEFVFAKKIYDYPAHHQFSKACSVSMSGYIAIGQPKSPNCKILHIKNGSLKEIKTLFWHKADIYNIRFSKGDKYLVTGGEDGKVFIFSLPEFNMVNILPPRPDYISNIHFGKFSNLVVYSSYDLMNYIFDIDTNQIVGEFATNSVAEDMTFFDEDRKIFFICSNGESGIYDIENKNLNLKQNYNSWLTRVGMTKDNNFAYIGRRDNILSYLLLDSNKSAFDVKLSYTDGISCMRVIDAKLYIGYSSGYLEIFNLLKYEKEFKQAIENNDFKSANEISKNNISLKTFQSYIDLRNKMWNIEFKKAKETLSKNQNAIMEIFNELGIFFEDDDKKREFDEFSKNLGIIKELNCAIEKENYFLAYKIIQEHSYLKQTLEYERLEAKYDSIFEAAKELLSHHNDEDTFEAQRLLKPFMSIQGKQENIKILLRNVDKFLQADKLFKNKQFGEFFQLAHSFKQIESTANYKKALMFGEQILATINELESNNQNKKALELLEVLMKFIPFKDIALERRNHLLLKLEFLDLYHAKNYKQIYQSIQKFHSIKGFKEYIELNHKFNHLFENALKFATCGDSENVFQILKPYFDIPFFCNKMESIFNISYLNEISLGLKKADAINWQKSLESYINMFGKNDELLKTCDTFPHIINIINNIESTQQKKVEFLPSIIH